MKLYFKNICSDALFYIYFLEIPIILMLGLYFLTFMNISLSYQLTLFFPQLPLYFHFISFLFTFPIYILMSCPGFLQGVFYLTLSFISSAILWWFYSPPTTPVPHSWVLLTFYLLLLPHLLWVLYWYLKCLNLGG